MLSSGLEHFFQDIAWYSVYNGPSINDVKWIYKLNKCMNQLIS